ncbi:MAG: DinB family protein [Bacteroidota bacterium]
MRIQSGELIEQLQADVRQLILTTGYLETEDTCVLTIQPEAGKWSVAQVLEHLNSYGRYYLPAIEKSMTGSTAPPAKYFRAGWLGNYFTRIMRPGTHGRITHKMKAPRGHTPVLVLDVKAVLHTFMQQQRGLLNLLEEAKDKDIGKIRTPVSISKFIKLKTGDTFRFLIAHEQRHFVQISNTLKQVKENEGNARLVKIDRAPAEAV